MKTLTALSLPAIVLLAASSPALAGKSDTANEVTLHIDADAATPPDRAEMDLQLKGTGSTAAEAQTALKAKQAELTQGLAAAGLGSSLVTSTEPTKVADEEVSIDTSGDMAACAAAEAAADVAAPRPARKGKAAAKNPCLPEVPAFAYQAVSTIKITDLRQLDKAQIAASPLGWSAYHYGYGLHYTTSDPVAAAKAAREQAIAKARKEADDYASSLGYHVVRMTRVSNASPPFSMGDLKKLTTYVDMSPSRMTPSYFGAATYVSVGIDFVIAPN